VSRRDDAAGVVNPAIRAIAFDWGGVFTVGTFDGRAIERLAALFDVPAARLRPDYLHLMEVFEVGGFDLPTFQARLSAAIGHDDVGEAEFRTAFLDAAVDRTAMYGLLAALPDEHAVGMLSNNVPLLCDRVREDPRTARIERFVFSNELGVRKPDATAFMALSEALQTAPAQTVFVDDAAANVEAARELGFRALLLDTPAGFAERWRATLPHLAHLVEGPGWKAGAP
jgi:putative hydrolase of the HAD superfamily